MNSDPFFTEPAGGITPAESFGALLRARGIEPRWSLPRDGSGFDVPEATTVLSFRFAEGVMMAGDRRATAGNLIAHRNVRKVFPADSYSAVAVSGTAGVAAEEDTATGGPDLQRDIYPSVVSVSAEGYSEMDEERVAAVARRVMGASA